MDCGAPRVEGPMAEKIFNYMMEQSKKGKSNAEKRKKRLEEFENKMKKKQRP